MASKVLILGLVVAAFLVAFFFMNTHAGCTILHGKNICNYYAVQEMFADSGTADFEAANVLCSSMDDVPKKDACFEIIPEHFSQVEP